MLVLEIFTKLLEKNIDINLKFVITGVIIILSSKELQGDISVGISTTNKSLNQNETIISKENLRFVDVRDNTTESNTSKSTEVNVSDHLDNENAEQFSDIILTGQIEPTSVSNEECVFIPQSEPKSPSFILIYIIICVYSFIGITVTCHQYFVTSMSRICEDFKLSEDIVGATFMAAGSSAPELATVIIAVFFTKNDIGISDVIGSAVFNMLFVIGLCGLFTTTVLHVNWWPLIRNCCFYTISIMVLLIAIADERVSRWESLLLIALYVLYCVALYYNEFLEAWVNTLPLPFSKLQSQNINSTDANYIPLEERKLSTYATTTESNTNFHSNEKIISSIQRSYQSNKSEDENIKNEKSGINLSRNSSFMEQMKIIFLNPVYYICERTIPDWQEDRFHNLYLLTFAVSFFWISVYSYIMIWMITIIGEILGIPNTVMGLTLVAAGVSVPDAVTSLKVIKEGYADMAVSNAIGSNIFDVLICLGIPWFLQTAVIEAENYAKVYSKGMIYATVLLFSTVILLLVAIHINGWKLDKRCGIVLMVGYCLFITIAVFYELFGSSTKQSCGLI